MKFSVILIPMNENVEICVSLLTIELVIRFWILMFYLM